MLSVNDPAVLAEIATLHDDYERALVAHDIAALDTFFWDSPHAVRYGVNEHLYGADAIAAYRRTAAAPPFTDRRLLHRSIVAFGPDTASVMCELSQKIFGQPKHSRQTQSWIRLPSLGWKIVAAHVSNAVAVPPSATSWDAYVDQAAAALGLPLAAEHRLGVIQNLQRSAAIVAPLLALDLPADVEVAAVFTP